MKVIIYLSTAANRLISKDRNDFIKTFRRKKRYLDFLQFSIIFCSGRT